LGYGLLVLALLLATMPVLSLAWRRWEAWQSLAPARNAGLDERVLFEPVTGRELQFNVSTHQGWFALQGFVVAAPAVRAQGVLMTIEVGLHGARGAERERRYLAVPAAEGAHAYGLLDGRAEQAAWVMPTEWIDLTGRPDVHAVSVRVLDAPKGARTVLWRGAIDQRLSDAQVRLRYRRLSDATREALTKDWVTPPALVDPRVKQELLRYRQQRIGPLGQAGEMFVARRVLRQVPASVPRRYDPRVLAFAISPALRVGVELDRERKVVIDARDAEGRSLAITVDGPFAAGAPPRRTRIDGRWRGFWVAGRYELRSDAKGDVDVRDADTGDVLTPSGLRPRAQRATARRILRYHLHALGELPPPVRLRLRAEQADAHVTVIFIDAVGAHLASRDINVPWQPSLYDRPAGALDHAASEAVQVDVQPPDGASVLTIAADVPVLAHVATTLQSSRREMPQRWYSFQPEVDPRSVLSQGVALVEQPRPKVRRLVQASVPRRVAMARAAAGVDDTSAHARRARIHSTASAPARGAGRFSGGRRCGLICASRYGPRCCC